jgi:uncharacterized PurR-regulated membrane protein YhhQ (DUF165 family)
MSLTARDLVHEAMGLRGVAAGMWPERAPQQALAAPEIAVASVVAFTISELFDAMVSGQLRLWTRMGAVGLSNAVGLVADSVLFVPMAFGSYAALPAAEPSRAPPVHGRWTRVASPS